MPGEISSLFEGDLAPRNLVDLLRVRAERQPEDLAFTFLHDGETDEVHLSMAALDWQARVIGGWLQERNAFGERVLLVYSPGLQFIAAFWGCLYAGAIAVPVYPPRLNEKLGRLQDVVTDSGATIVLTDPSTNAKVSPLVSQFAALRDLKWMVSDDLLSAAQRPGSVDLANTWQPPDLKSTTLAFLQY